MSNALPMNYTELLSEGLAALAEVRLGYLFGSRAKDAARPSSDLDIAVLVDNEFAADPGAINRTIRRIAAHLSGDISSQLLDLVLLNTAPTILRHRVLRDGVLLYARSEQERVRFTTRTIREYCDLEPMLAQHRSHRIARLKRGIDIGGSGDILKAAQGT